MRYAQALERLYALQSRGIRLGATRMHGALALRGHPERGRLFVQVGGTNGKGSVSAMIAACLSRAGYRTGLFTSPHLHRYVERVRIDGRALSESEATRRIADLLACFAQRAAPETTFFELTTLLALEAFRDHRCEIVVLEVGLGGRLDATTAVTPAVSVITRVALDHTQILGDSIAQIAREKAGIAKPGVPLVVGVRDVEARRVITRHARRVGAPVSSIDRDFGVVAANARPDRFDVRVGERAFPGLRVALHGQHQLDNAACAVAALTKLEAHGFAVSLQHMRAGLARVRWPGRLEQLAGEPRFLFDAAHNLDGCEALVRFLRERDANADAEPAKRSTRARRVLVFGAMADKDYGRMLRVLAPQFDRVFFCPPPLARAASSAQLRRYTRGVAARNTQQALARARKAAGTHGEVVVAGSIFLVAEARALVLGLRSDPPIRM